MRHQLYELKNRLLSWWHRNRPIRRAALLEEIRRGVQWRQDEMKRHRGELHETRKQVQAVVDRFSGIRWEDDGDLRFWVKVDRKLFDPYTKELMGDMLADKIRHEFLRAQIVDRSWGE